MQHWKIMTNNSWHKLQVAAFAQLAVVGRRITHAFMSQRFLRCVKVTNNAFASSFVLKSEKPQWKRINYCSRHTVKMQWVIHKCLTGSVDLRRIEPPLTATPTRDDRQNQEMRKWLLKLEQSFTITGDWQYER